MNEDEIRSFLMKARAQFYGGDGKYGATVIFWSAVKEWASKPGGSNQVRCPCGVLIGTRDGSSLLRQETVGVKINGRIEKRLVIDRIYQMTRTCGCGTVHVWGVDEPVDKAPDEA